MKCLTTLLGVTKFQEVLTSRYIVSKSNYSRLENETKQKMEKIAIFKKFLKFFISGSIFWIANKKKVEESQVLPAH